jgi:hypothetical protein
LGLESPTGGFVLQGLPSTASTMMGVWAFSFSILIVTTPLACCAFIVLYPSRKLYNNAVIIQLPAVPSEINYVHSSRQWMEALWAVPWMSALYKGQSGGTLRRPLWQVPKDSPFTCTVQVYYSTWGIG